MAELRYYAKGKPQPDRDQSVVRVSPLPCVAENRLVILPDMSGIYVADGVGVLEINGFDAKINNGIVAIKPDSNNRRLFVTYRARL